MDASVPGGHGTDSEVVFALALGRPVVLVGEDWNTSFPLSQDLAAREALLRSARRRVRGDGGTELDALISRAYDAFPTGTLRVERLSLEHLAKQIVSTAGLVDEVGAQADFPTLRDREELVAVAGAYREWLTACCDSGQDSQRKRMSGSKAFLLDPQSRATSMSGCSPGRQRSGSEPPR